MISYVFVDSNNRTQGDPSNSYRLELMSPLKNISKVELVSAKIPNSMYNVIIGSIAINGVTSNIEPGFYNPCGLSSVVPGVQTEYNPDTGRFTFSSILSFTIEALSKDLQKCLGLSSGVKTSTTNSDGLYVVTSDSVVDMNVNDFIFLDIEELRSTSMVDCKVFTGNTMSASTINSVFAVIPLDVDPGCMKFFKETSDYKMSTSFTAPIGTLSRLTIRWLDRNGSPLNFNGLDDNSFVLRVYTVSEPKPQRIELPLPVPKAPELPQKQSGGGKKYILIGGGIGLIVILLWFFLKPHSTPIVQRPLNYSQIPMRRM